MAKLFPDLLPAANSQGGLNTELEVLRTLEHELPEAYALFHSVGWTRADGGREQHGEADIVVVNQAGDLLIIEVKAGAVELEGGEVFKQYRDERKSVQAQIGRTYQGMRRRLEAAGLPVEVHTLIVLPQAQVKGATMDSPRTRIVDSSEMAHLAYRVRDILDIGMPNSDYRQGVIDFLSQMLDIEPDVSALTGQLAEHTTRLSSGLATWVPRIYAPHRIIRVVATAGSGKTQLALHQLRAADAAGFKAGYFCFNRALADHLGRIAPPRVRVETFHEMAVQTLRDAGEPPDFGRRDIWTTIAARAAELLADREPWLDLLVVDEMQDFKPEWVKTLLGLLKPTGQALLLEDPEQVLYKDREPFDIPDEVIMRSPDNHRSPRVVTDLINALKLTEEPVRSPSAWPGQWSEPRQYDGSEADLLAQTEGAVKACLARGFGIEQIALLTVRGASSSALLKAERLTPWPLRKFSGKYADGGVPIWTDGQLLADSVHRFKGQAAPAVVLSEIDFEELDKNAKRRLFVGLTRARVHWEWVVSRTTMRQIAIQLA